MSSITDKLEGLRRSGKKGFIPFVTAGDPDLDTSLSIIKVLAESGADVIELGVPFSDPMADGPTIQASSQRALENGTTLGNVLELVKSFRAKSDVPIILFSYLNPLLQFGLERLRDKTAEIGVDGILITDIVDDEAIEIGEMMNEKNLDLISLVAPTTSDERLQQICSRARGFIYAVSRAGVTGARSNVSDEAKKLVCRVRKYTDLSIAVGFGISNREQMERVWSFADAAVVGSAIVAEIGRANDPEAAITRVRSFVRALLPQVAKTPSGI